MATKEEIRELAEADLYTFACLVNPHRVYGDVHRDLFDWWVREDAKDNQLVLFPRDHQKSHCLAVRVAWAITRDPAITVLYVSATSALAEKQLYAIKNILTSKAYQTYWPEMVHPEEGKRELWNSTEIAVDHPKREAEGIRDATVMAAGLTTNITGFHCDIAALDDVVVPRNVETQEGRTKVSSMYSQLASIETTDAKEWAVGTRYDPRDLYGVLLEMEEDIFDGSEIIGSERVYEIFERVVEDSSGRDGTGEFLWPRQRRRDGKYFGFDTRTLARKRAKYVDRHQFFAQYYNDPNDEANAPIQIGWVQYYDKRHLEQVAGKWFIKDRRLNVVAAMDFAFSKRKRADYSAIVIVGIDSEHNYYVLDIVRFKTDSIREMFDKLLEAYYKWDFSKLRAEVSVGQLPIVRELKTKMTETGVFFSIDEYRPTRHEGTKEERMDAILTPRYENQKMWHYRGGNCQTLEDELRQSKPEHDDIKDALANAVDLARAPAERMHMRDRQQSNVVTNARFGGMR